MASSPAWNYVSLLWSVKQFAIETDNGWGRSEFGKIDRQLSLAKAAEHGDPKRYVEELVEADWRVPRMDDQQG